MSEIRRNGSRYPDTHYTAVFLQENGRVKKNKQGKCFFFNNLNADIHNI